MAQYPELPPFAVPNHRWAEPLLRAIMKNDIEDVTKALLADPGVASEPLCGLGRGFLGRAPPLLEAVRCGCDAEILHVLMKHGALIDDADANGITPLLEVSGASLRADGPVHSLWSDWKRPTSGMNSGEKVSTGNPGWDEMFKFMRSTPPALKPVSPFTFPSLRMSGNTPTLRGIQAGVDEDSRYAFAKCLLSFGANVSKKDSRGLSAADHAERQGMSSVQWLLGQWAMTKAMLQKHRSLMGHTLSMESTRAPIASQLGLLGLPEDAFQNLLMFVA